MVIVPAICIKGWRSIIAPPGNSIKARLKGGAPRWKSSGSFLFITRIFIKPTNLCEKTVMQKFSPAELAVLFANIEVDDEIDLAASLPGRVDFACSVGTRRACYYMALQLLNTYVDIPAFRRLVATIIAQRAADADQIAAYRKARTCFKHMRFCCANFDARHRYPQHLNAIIVTQGRLQDAIINRQKARIVLLGSQLWLMLSPVSCYFLRQRLAAYRPGSDKRYYRRLNRENGRLAQFLTREPLAGTGEELHSLRKIISRRVALNDALRSLRPSAGLDAVSLYLASLNGMLGDVHDDLIKWDAAGTIDYKRHVFTLPPAIADRLKIFSNSQIRYSP
ncbi:hypothetical protein DPQ22_00520, partial [Candidatus Tokpelaia sp.]